ncbi:hypothetical protein [Ralstonia solanacearum]|uniref:hypothetical protein n=1 Tax=Ralstonia solanacearum TaxID=305 RepID=UPI0013C34105|nr:hypothetical protein [Ralstonia solanacearum]
MENLAILSGPTLNPVNLQGNTALCRRSASSASATWRPAMPAIGLASSAASKPIPPARSHADMADQD